ncbi:MAG TPA: tetratricopeptide repeat protein [Steroidobacter sp.]|uniref:tetratricopeptide repeat protein n=1 Tax=Steroidobacter sp. TaxID=1978227 RepID=UPI002ED88882
MKKVLGAAILALLSPLAWPDDLRDARSVLQHIEGAAAKSAARSESAQLLADVQQFRKQYRQLTPRVAAERWFEQLDRARALPAPQREMDPASFDPDISRSVSIRSMLASIPAPEAWPEMRAIAVERVKNTAQSDVADLAVQLLTEALNNDAAAVKSTFARLESAASKLDPEARKQAMATVVSARSIFASMYGTPADVVSAYEAALNSIDKGEAPESLMTPDLVAMVGAERAAPLLRRAVTGPQVMSIQGGEETRRLARQLALENVAQMRVPQWRLLDSIDAAPLYEAITQRFGASTSGAFESVEGIFSGDGRDEAGSYYLLSTIVGRQQQKAEAVLAQISSTGLDLPEAAVKALRDAGQSEALVEFLHGALSKQPELLAWDVYIEQSSYVGRSKQALELVREVKKRPNLPAYLSKNLAAVEVEALLANNRIEDAIASLRMQIAAPPGADNGDVLKHVANATRLARIGRLLARRELVREGLTAARAALPMVRGSSEYERRVQTNYVYETYRRMGNAVGAQQVAIAELARDPDESEAAEQFGFGMANEGKRAALVELVGIYVAANRPEDALALLQQAKQWGARDLADFVEQKDSLGTPVGYAAARALADNGERDAALRALRALLKKSPGYDAAYELLVKLSGPQSIAELDELYLRDQFEERPLIWKARVLADAKRLKEAEEVIRRAIEIDPSDGEQPADDRLRAYAVLADIVAASGRDEEAATYRQALDAIRISERADQFHEVGLYDRAFAMYRDSLARFSDAYCIQSRLAIQLSQQGRHQEAVAHYRRAYELMPDSFGRVESHCFGCENVFADPTAKSIAEQVFTQALQRDRQKPQAHYLLGYLRKEQGRYAEALQSFRNAVALDDGYLNAWKQLNELGERTYIEPAEREIFQQKLLQLDPRQRHVRYDLRRVRDLAKVWRELQKQRDSMPAGDEGAFRLTANARKLDDAMASLPPELRAQAEVMGSYAEQYDDLIYTARDPRRFLAGHVVTKYVSQLMDAEDAYY